MKEERNYVDSALLTRYPSIKRTVERARKLGFEVYWHRAYFSKRGAVYQHWLYLKDSETGKSKAWRHQDLKDWCSVLEEAHRKAKQTGL